ncbi:HU family DNA-binding protein [Rickettsia endosymbiont of Cardiosporidium cionae]|uniref:HU family DNA-binding protein n=1 Tax=Rickettsia endosymbiont of Cardiosporidium cionae TaxID=2777155 RepID=UPI001896344C|nr:HU family DNA-binding protein [Rickettsia endosymbiont of Cardiosporidium cionae]KAF8818998.1 integration host factor subunit beta [Rickettsia endosymbiont of Cardiosporidium cionae]
MRYTKNQKSPNKLLIEHLSKRLSYIAKDDLIDSVNLVQNYIISELKIGNRIEIRNFGSFFTKKKKIVNSDASYNKIYYRMSKNTKNILNT